MRYLIEYLLGVLIETSAHFLIKEIEKKKPRRRAVGKHMRKG